MIALLLCLAFYIIGCFPTGYLVGRLYGVTIWKHGSGNIGATNVSRVLGKKAGLFTLIGDLLKGFLPIVILDPLGFVPQNIGCLSLFLVLGHCLSIPPFLKGGKGVATALGIYLAISPLLALFAVLTFAIAMAAARIVSLASILAAVLVPIFSMICYSQFYQPYTAWLMVISAVVIYRHKANLQRLIAGQEPKFSFKKESS
jgi:acyl phosphate:glycerol-3-phosphate acyltransferase